MSDILFTGEFDLVKSYNTFDGFIKKIEKRLLDFNKGVQARLSAQNQAKVDDRVNELYNELSRKANNAATVVQQSQQRIREAMDTGTVSIDSGNRAIIGLDQTLERYQKTLRNVELREEENIKNNKSHVLQLRQLEDAYDDILKTITRVESKLNSGNQAFREANKVGQQLFKGLAIGGFALQQFGAFWGANVTRPLINFTKYATDALFTLNDFEERLIVTAGKTAEQVQKITQTARDVAKRPNIGLKDTIELFGKLEELTRGGIDTDKLERIGKGLSVSLSGISAAERTRFFAEIEDVLAGGETSNFEKTLGQTAILRRRVQELIQSTDINQTTIQAAGFSGQTEVLIKALESLANEKAPDSLRTQFENLTDRVWTLAGAIADLYKDRLKSLFDYLDNTALPAMERFVETFGDLPSWVQNLTLALGGLAAALGPVVYIIGTLGVVTAGIAYLFDVVVKGMALFTGNAIAAELATSGLAATLAESGGLIASLTTILEGVSAFLLGVGGIVTGIVAIVAYAIATIPELRDEFGKLVEAIGDQLAAIWTVLEPLVDILGTLLKSLLDFLASGAGFGLLILLRALTLIIVSLSIPLRTVAALVQFVEDLFSKGGLSLAIQRINLAFAEMQLQIIELVPGLERFINWLSSGSENETLRERVERLRRETATLTKSQSDLNKEKEKDAKLSSELKLRNENLAKSIKAINDAIAEQTEQTRQARQEYALQQQEAANAASKRAATEQISILDRKIDKYDLANPAQAQAALRDLNAKGSLALQIAQRDAELEIQRKENEFRDELYKELSKMEFNDKRLGYILQQIFSQETEVNKIFERIRNELPSGQESSKVRDYLNQKIVQLQIMRDGYGQYFEASRDLISAQNSEFQRLQDEINEANKKLTATRNAGNIQAAVDSYQAIVDKLEKELTALDELKISYSEKYERFDNIIKQITIARKSIAVLEEQLANAQNPNNVTAGVEAENTRKSKEREYEQAEAARRQAYTKKILDAKEQRGKILSDAEIALRDSKRVQKKLQEVLQSIASTQNIVLGADSKAFFTPEIFEQANEADRGLQTINKLLSSFSTLSQEGTLPTVILNKFERFYQGAPSLNQKAVEDSLTAQIKFVQDLIKEILETDWEALGLNPADFTSVDLQNMLELATKNLKLLQKTKDEIVKSKEDIARKNKEAGIYDKQRRLTELQDLADILDLERQIAQTRLERNQGTQGTFGAAIYDILTGAREKALEIEQRRLEVTGQIRKLELEIAISRLEIEKEITLEQLRRNNADPKIIEEYTKRKDREIDLIRQRSKLEQDLANEQIRQLNKFGSTFGSILGRVFGEIFKPKKKKDTEKDEPAVSDESTDKTAENAKEQISWLDQLSGKMAVVRDLSFAVGEALLSLSEFSLQGILKAIKAEFDALAKKALIKALEYTAIALSALVFGDFGTAARAGKAAAAWGAVAVAAKAGSALVGLGIKKDTDAATSQASRQAGTSKDEEERKRIAKMKAQEIYVRFDIRTEEGILVQKYVKALNSNTKLTTLTSNSQAGWSFPPA